MFRKIKIAATLVALAVASPAAASVTITFGGSSPTSGPSGNVATHTSGGLAVQASAWFYDGGSLQTAFLGQYAGGLSVTNSTEGLGAAASANAIDNSYGYDFVLLVFNQPVTMLSAVLTPYQTGFGQPDNDATIAYTNAEGIFTSPNPTALPITSPVWSGLVSTAFSVAGNNSAPYATAISPGSRYGNAWLVSADILGLDRSPDGFRLTSVTVNTPAVPEPATWAMFLLGFFGIASTVRRANPKRSVFAQVA